MARTLLILRHAKSSWKDPGLDDHDRPLNKRGKRDPPRMGQLLLDEDLLPDLIVTSTATRARETARRVAAAIGYDEPIEEIERLYLAGVDDLIDVVRGIADARNRVMLVGHNPGLEDLVGALTGIEERLPTAALVEIGVDAAHWADLAPAADSGLVRVWRPRELA